VTSPSCLAGGIALYAVSQYAPHSPTFEQSHTDEVAVLEIEAVELIASLLSIHYVLIDNEGSALGIASNTLADLAT
jgi:hypothetical protein